jgi:hypothetical protein
MRGLGLTVLLGAAAVACKSTPALLFRDSEGRAFRAHCEQRDECTLEQRSGPRWSGDKRGLALRSESRIVGVCNTAEGSPVESPADCRPLVCAKDTDCPPAHGLPKGSCLGGLCTDQSRAIDVSDAVMLCFAETGLGRGTPAQVERLAMAEQCGTPCTVPTPCRQP